jgi:hypothetical protein
MLATAINAYARRKNPSLYEDEYEFFFINSRFKSYGLFIALATPRDILFTE